MPDEITQLEKIQLRGRSGLVLVAVLVVIVILSLSAYAFTQSMRLEAKAVGMKLRMTQARLLAESGVELTRALLILQGQGLHVPDLADAPDLFQGITLFDADEDVHPRLLAQFSVMTSTQLKDGASVISTVQFGVSDENSKLDLNFWANRDQVRLRQILESSAELPGDVADAIIGRIVGGGAGASSGPVLKLLTPYGDRPPSHARQGPLETMDELLQVAGVSAELLYGENSSAQESSEFNRVSSNPATRRPEYAQTMFNRTLGATGSPLNMRSGDWGAGTTGNLGPRSVPLADSVTIYARSSETDHLGKPRICLNDPDLPALYRRLESEFGEQLARFVIAFRVFGTGSTSNDSKTPATVPTDDSKVGRYQFTSVTELVGGQVQGKWQGRPVSVTSPISSNPADLRDRLPHLLDRLTVNSTSLRLGTINVNTAPEEVLAILPLSPAQRSAILGHRLAANPLRNDLSPRHGLAWLISDGIVSLDQYRNIEPLVTDRSEVYRVRALGYFAERGPWVEIEAVVDGSRNPPDLVFYRDHVGPPPREFRDAIVGEPEARTLPDLTNTLFSDLANWQQGGMAP